MEIRAVEGWDGYFVCDNGDVIGKKGRVLKGKVDRYGYLMYVLSDGKRRKCETGHRLVAKAFIDNPNKLATVNHKNGVKIDNSVGNLEWMTFKDNSLHALETGIYSVKGTCNPISKLHDIDVVAILSMFHFEKLSPKEICKLFKMSLGCIEKICYMESWRHISVPFLEWNGLTHRKMYEGTKT